ncbi:MAG: helix-turn-helix domain-containing protein [Oscillospiraceae bacterium]|nr:helix-turn-helix domain-containing protein [Oscillospiraceae bacterium]
MYISSKEAQKLLCVSANQLYRLVDAGKVPAYKPAGRLLFNRSKLMSYIEDSRVTPKDSVSRTISKKRREDRQLYVPGEKVVSL